LLPNQSVSRSSQPGARYAGAGSLYFTQENSMFLRADTKFDPTAAAAVQELLGVRPCLRSDWSLFLALHPRPEDLRRINLRRGLGAILDVSERRVAADLL
jgi:hypothetical protein